MNNEWEFETKTVKGVYSPENGKEWVLPISQSTTYNYNSTSELAKLFDLEAEGHMYSRISNPTTQAFEGKMAALEGGVGACATSSGQSASFLSIVNIASSGDNVLAASAIYGGTINLFSTSMKKLGIEIRWFNQDESTEDIIAKSDNMTKAVFAESLANPALIVLDFEKVSAIAKQLKVPFIVDNTFPTPYLCSPLELGADIVVHSATKYIDGHATSVGGVIIDGGKFDWTCSDKFSELYEPDQSYHGVKYVEQFGEQAYIIKVRTQWIRDLGNYLAPFNAWLAHKGLETLHLRMDRHSENAIKVAEFLNEHEKVSWVNYPGLENNSEYQRAQKYLPKGCSGVMSFGLKGGRQDGMKFIEGCELVGQVVHVGDLRTIALHPASTTHRQLTDSELTAAGIPAELIRLSVGIENVNDIIKDIASSLETL